MKLFGTSKINEKGNLSIGGVDTIELAKEFKTHYEIGRASCRERV